MPFVKIDTGILNSTLWDDRYCRDVFLTALFMAEPIEYTEPVQTFHIRRIELTDFVIPPGWYGIVNAAGVGIVRRALVETEAGLDALERLMAPDPGSRSKKFDGRRLVRVDGGFIALNYMDYRDRDYTSAERSRRYRARQKKQAETVASHRDVITSRRDITQAEAEVEEQTKNQQQRRAAKADDELPDVQKLESHLAAQLGSDQERRALTAILTRALSPFACVTSLTSTLSGNDASTPKPTAAQFGQALVDLNANGEGWNAARFRGYLKRAVPASEQLGSVNGRRAKAGGGARNDAALDDWLTKSGGDDGE